MPINPFPRVQGLDLPTALPSAAAAPPGTFANLGSIGDAIGEYRERQALSGLARQAIGPDGQLDMNKFASAVALSGRDPARVLSLLQTERAQSRAEAAQKRTASHYDVTEDLARKEQARREQQFQQGEAFTVEDPLGIGPARRFRRLPDGKTIEDTLPPRAVGPQSALPGGPGDPNLAAAEPDPENAPPYQVAGPPVPAPSTPPTVAPPPAPDREVKLKQFEAQNGPEAAAIFRDILDYKRPLPGEDKLKQRWINAARALDPTFDPNKYDQEKKRPTVSGEMAARLGIGGKFLVDMEDQQDEQGKTIPGIRSRVAAGELSKDYPTALAAQYYKGGPGEVRRLIDDGAEGLIRMLTGAGMNREEAEEYGNRYKFSFRSNTKESLSKVDDLADVIKSVSHAVETGKTSPEELRKVLGPRKASAFAKDKEVPKVANDAQATQLIDYAREALKNKTHTREFLLKDLERRGVPNPELYLR